MKENNAAQAANLPTVLSFDERERILCQFMREPINHDREMAIAIESAVLSKLRAPVADSTLPLEKALHELVSKIDPGLDTGDLLQDAQRASAMLDAIQPVLTDADIEEIRQDWHCFFQSSTQGGVGVCIRDIERRVLSQVRTPVPDERQLLVALQAIAEHPDSGEWNLGAAKLREIARAALASAPVADERELHAAAQAFYEASKTVVRFAVESLDDRDALVAASVRLRAALSATQPEQGFTECVFDGPAPEGYKSWHAWCTTPVKSGAFIRAARVDDWAKNPTGEDTKP